MNRKLFKIMALLSAGCVLMTGCGGSSKDKTPTLNVTEYGKNEVIKTLTLDGNVESTDKNSTITTELVNYKVKTLNFKVGDYVNKDDVICELDTTEIENDIADLEKLISNSKQLSDYDYDQYKKALEKTKENGNETLADAQKDIDSARNQYNNQKSEYDKYINIYNECINSANQAKEMAESTDDEQEKANYSAQYQASMESAGSAMAAYEAASAGMKQAEASIRVCENIYNQKKQQVDGEISSAQYKVDRYSLEATGSSENQKQLDELKLKLEKAKIKSDKSGIVASVSAEEGKVCAEGIILTVQSASDMCVHVNVKEEDMLDIKSGMKAIITTSARDKQEYTGSVDRVIDIKSEAGFDGYINIDDSTDFRIGMTAKVKIVLSDDSDMLSVNNSCIFKKDDMKYVYEVEKQTDGTYKVRKAKIEEGNKNDKYTVISGESLEEGDLIATSPSRCSDGDIVKIRNSKKDKENKDSSTSSSDSSEAGENNG